MAQVGVLAPPRDGAAPEVLLVRADHLDADRLLELEDETGADRLHDRGSARLLTVLRIVEVAVLGRVDVRDGAAADDVGHAVGEQLAPHDEHAGRARAADELVRAEEDRVLVGERMVCALGPHLDLDVRRGRGEVPERERRRGGAGGRRWRSVFEKIPVTLEAAEKEPILSGRSRCRSSSASSASRST